MGFFSKLFSFNSKRNFLDRKETELLAKLEAKIDYRFKDISLLKKALSHRSFAFEKKQKPKQHNERLEFLGDAVLGLALSHKMMRHFPEHTEGDLSKLRAALVSEASLCQVAKSFGLGEFLFLGKSEEKANGRDKASILADTYEALLGAIFLDGGFDPVTKIIRLHFLAVLQKSKNQDIIRDYKTRLQEEAQNRFKVIPEYRLLDQSGPDHKKVFQIGIFISDRLYGLGQGKSKKQAEQMAASQALAKIEQKKNSENKASL